MASHTNQAPRNSGDGRKKVLRSLLDQARQFKLTPAHYLSVAEQIWQDLNTPRSLTCALLLKYGEYAQLVRLECNPATYVAEWTSPYSPRGGRQFRDDYQATQLLAKWPNFVHEDLDPGLACEKADLDAEHSCVMTNKRILAAFANPTGENSAHLHLIFEMQADIARVLGSFCPEKWEDSCRFGPGKASGQKGTVDYEKLVTKPSCTEDFLPMGVSLIAGSIPWLEAVANSGLDPNAPSSDVEGESYAFAVTVEPGDRCTMVPKNAKTMRGIRAQPGLNVYAQLGIGRMVRDRLKLHGLDLDDQVPNQDLAKLGSLPGRPEVTVDLKGASGHICTVLVRTLCESSPRWLHAMDLTRTSRYLPHGSCDEPGNWVPLASYSAMGNGYTFELETLIFWAAVRACRRSLGENTPYRVYGDDIICSRKTADILIPFLNFLGFPINAGKTFLEGPFRESCGADFWLGTNIRPIHFSTSVEEIEEANNDGTSLLRWVSTCNAVRKMARSRNHGFGCDSTVLPSWRAAVLRIPRGLRDSLKGPWDDERDDYIITSDEDAMTNPLVRVCGSLQTLISPRLSIVQKEARDPMFLGAKACLLYRLQSKDRVAVRYDRTRSWLRKFLQAPPVRVTRLQKLIHNRCCQGNPSTASTVVIPSRAFRLGAGWEVFQPVGSATAWW